MSIAGIGLDLEDITRIADLLARQGDAFKHKVFTTNEIAYCDSRPDPPQHFAARFAAKEALAKAVGTGWSGAFRWHDAEIRNDERGRPELLLHGALAERTRGHRTHLSLSHTSTHVAAVVILERD